MAKLLLLLSPVLLEHPSVLGFTILSENNVSNQVTKNMHIRKRSTFLSLSADKNEEEYDYDAAFKVRKEETAEFYSSNYMSSPTSSEDKDLEEEVEEDWKRKSLIDLGISLALIFGASLVSQSFFTNFWATTPSGDNNNSPEEIIQQQQQKKKTPPTSTKVDFEDLLKY